MSTQNSIFGEAFAEVLRTVIREELQAAGNGQKESELLSPEELAKRLKGPLSWRGKHHFSPDS